MTKLTARQQQIIDQIKLNGHVHCEAPIGFGKSYTYKSKQHCMCNIFSESYPNSKFYKFMDKVQTIVLCSGLTFFAFVIARMIFNF